MDPSFTASGVRRYLEITSGRDVREFEAEIFWVGQWGYEIEVGNVHGHELCTWG